MKLENKRKKTVAVILTGGRGTRIKNIKTPKQFVKVFGKPLFIHCLERYQSIREIDEICLVINKKYQKYYDLILRNNTFTKLRSIVAGGTYRQDSIRNAIKTLMDTDLVVLQNGANPTTPTQLIRKCISLAKAKGASTAYVPAMHTVFIKNNYQLEKVLNRQDIGYTCDPQVYKLDILKRSFSKLKEEGSRDVPTVDLIKRTGHKVYLALSDTNNLKVTTADDFKAVENILKRSRHLI